MLPNTKAIQRIASHASTTPTSMGRAVSPQITALVTSCAATTARNQRDSKSPPGSASGLLRYDRDRQRYQWGVTDVMMDPTISG